MVPVPRRVHEWCEAAGAKGTTYGLDDCPDVEIAAGPRKLTVYQGLAKGLAHARISGKTSTGTLADVKGGTLAEWLTLLAVVQPKGRRGEHVVCPTAIKTVVDGVRRHSSCPTHRGWSDEAACLTATSTPQQVLAVARPLVAWLQALRAAVGEYGADTLDLLAAGVSMVHRLVNDLPLGPDDPQLTLRLSQLGSEMCPSSVTHDFLARVAAHLAPDAYGSPSFHLAFESRLHLRRESDVLTADTAQQEIGSLVLTVFCTVVLAGFDEDPDRVLEEDRAIMPPSMMLLFSSLLLFPDSLRLLAALFSQLPASEQSEIVQRLDDDERSRSSTDDSSDSVDEPSDSESDSTSPSSSSRSSATSSSSVDASLTLDASSDDSESDVDALLDRRIERSLRVLDRAIGLDYVSLDAVADPTLPVRLGSLRFVHILASIARSTWDPAPPNDSDDDDAGAGSEEEGVESLHMSTDEDEDEDESDDERVDERVDDHEDELDDEGDDDEDHEHEQVEEASAESPPADNSAADAELDDEDVQPAAVHQHSVPFDDDLCRLNSELSRLLPDTETQTHDGVDDEDPTRLPFRHLVVDAAPVVVRYAESALRLVRGAAREGRRILQALESEPTIIPDPATILFVLTCSTQALRALGATSIVRARTKLAHRSVVIPRGFNTLVVPESVRTLAQQHGTTPLDAVLSAVAAPHVAYGVPSVQATVEPTRTVRVLDTPIPLLSSHVLLQLLAALKKRAENPNQWFAATPLLVAGKAFGSFTAQGLKTRSAFITSRLASEAPASMDHVPRLRLATPPTSEPLCRRTASLLALVSRFGLLYLQRAVTAATPIPSLTASELATVAARPLRIFPPSVASTLRLVLRFALCLPVLQHVQSCVLALLPPVTAKAIAREPATVLRCPLPTESDAVLPSDDARSFVIECLRRAGLVRGDDALYDDRGNVLLSTAAGPTIERLGRMISVEPRSLAATLCTVDGSVNSASSRPVDLRTILRTCPSAARAVSTLSDATVLQDLVQLSVRSAYRPGIGGRHSSVRTLPPDAPSLVASLVAAATAESLDEIATLLSLDLLPLTTTVQRATPPLSVAKLHASFARTARWGGTEPSLMVASSASRTATVATARASCASLCTFMQRALSPCLSAAQCSLVPGHALGWHTHIAAEGTAPLGAQARQWVAELPTLFTSMVLSPDYHRLLVLWTLHACATAAAAASVAHQLAPRGLRNKGVTRLTSEDLETVSSTEVDKVVTSIVDRAEPWFSSWVVAVLARLQQHKDKELLASLVDSTGDHHNSTLPSFRYCFDVQLPGWPQRRTLCLRLTDPSLVTVRTIAQSFVPGSSVSTARKKEMLASVSPFKGDGAVTVLESAMSPVFSFTTKTPTDSGRSSRRAKRTFTWNVPEVTATGSLHGCEEDVRGLLASLASLVDLDGRQATLVPLAAARLLAVMPELLDATGEVEAALAGAESFPESMSQSDSPCGDFDFGGGVEHDWSDDEELSLSLDRPELSVDRPTAMSTQSPPSTPIAARPNPCSPTLSSSLRPTKRRRRTLREKGGGEVGEGFDVDEVESVDDHVEPVDDPTASAPSASCPATPPPPSPPPPPPPSIPPPPPVPTPPPQLHPSISTAPFSMPRTTRGSRKPSPSNVVDYGTAGSTVGPLDDVLTPGTVAPLSALPCFMSFAPSYVRHEFSLMEPSNPLPFNPPMVSIVQVPGDGDCLFHSLSMLLFEMGHTPTHVSTDRLRSDCVSLLADAIAAEVDVAKRGDAVLRQCVLDVWHAMRTSLRETNGEDGFLVLSNSTKKKQFHRPRLPDAFGSVLPKTVRGIPRHYFYLYSVDGVEHYADIPAYCPLKFKDLSKYTGIPADRTSRLGALAMCYMWAKTIYATPGTYVNLTVAQLYFCQLEHVVATTTILPDVPLLVADARWPYDPSDVLLPSSNRVARVVRATQAYPKFWLFQNHNHYVVGVTVNTDEE
jgi:hypothetical protein